MRGSHRELGAFRRRPMGVLSRGRPRHTRAGTSGYWDEPSTPLFPFGHGLSYTSFEVSGAAVTPNPSHTMFSPGDVFNISGTIKSSGPSGRITLFAFFSQVCVRWSL